MKYKDLIETLSEIINNEKILKQGLTLTYVLNRENHRRMNEELFYKSNPIETPVPHSDEIEVEISGITVKFIPEKV